MKFRLSSSGGVAARIGTRKQLGKFRDPRQAAIAKDSGLPTFVILFRILQAIIASTRCGPSRPSCSHGTTRKQRFRILYFGWILDFIERRSPIDHKHRGDIGPFIAPEQSSIATFSHHRKPRSRDPRACPGMGKRGEDGVPGLREKEGPGESG